MAQFPSSSGADGIWTLKQNRRGELGGDWPELAAPLSHVGTATANFPNASPSNNLTFPSGTQAGDTAIIVQGFSGYNGSGGVASGESSLSVTPDSQTDYVWGEFSGSTNYCDTVYIINSLTSSTVSGGYLYLTSLSGSVTTYSLATMIIVRGAGTPAVRSTHDAEGRTAQASTPVVVNETSGSLPTSGVNTSGILFNVITDRQGANVYQDTQHTYNFLKQTEVHDQGGSIFSQPCYKISYANYVSGGHSSMIARLQVNVSNTYTSNSIVISV
jgi:hypothetical protein